MEASNAASTLKKMRVPPLSWACPVHTVRAVRAVRLCLNPFEPVWTARECFAGLAMSVYKRGRPWTQKDRAENKTLLGTSFLEAFNAETRDRFCRLYCCVKCNNTVGKKYPESL
jgi:hypothetical protein